MSFRKWYDSFYKDVTTFRIYLKTAWYAAKKEDKERIKELESKLAAANELAEAVASLNLNKIDGYMLLGKNYKEILSEALKEYKDK